MLSVTDPTGRGETATYDYLGRELTTTEVVRQTGQRHTTNYTYDAGGLAVQTGRPPG